MKKLALLLVAIALLGWGCSHSFNSMMTSGVDVDLSGTSKYKILGDTEATANVKIILGLIKLGDASMSGSFPVSLTPLAGGKLICEQAAAYKAIQNFEGADQIICPRFKTELNLGIGIIYQDFTSTVKAKAVKVIP